MPLIEVVIVTVLLVMASLLVWILIQTPIDDSSSSRKRSSSPTKSRRRNDIKAIRDYQKNAPHKLHKECKKFSEKDVSFGGLNSIVHRGAFSGYSKVKASDYFSSVCYAGGGGGIVVEAEKNLIGYKATRYAVVQLIVPKGATIVIPRGSKRRDRAKLRCDRVFVSGFYLNSGKEDNRRSDNSIHKPTFTYNRGELILPKSGLDTSTDAVCSRGIHLFPTFGEAVSWHRQHGYF